MKKNYGYIILTKNMKYIPFDQKIWKTKAKAKNQVKKIKKANSIEKRKQVGFVNVRIKKVELSDREIKEMKSAKHWIYFS